MTLMTLNDFRAYITILNKYVARPVSNETGQKIFMFHVGYGLSHKWRSDALSLPVISYVHEKYWFQYFNFNMVSILFGCFGLLHLRGSCDLE